jgi:predicted nucleic acid-binding protein
MSRQIKDIAKLDIKEYDLYFVDTNVWVYLLQAAQFNGFEVPYHQKYSNFLEKIITHHIKNKPKPPKIVVNTLLLAEMLNAYMRQVAMYKYFKKIGDEPKNKKFKEDYRGTEDYKRRLKTLIDDFRSYEDYFVFMDLTLDIPKFLDTYVQNLSCDLNDYYFYVWAKENNIAIITDDADYDFGNIPIITANKKLIEKV